MVHSYYTPVWFNGPRIVRFVNGKFSIKWGTRYGYCPISQVDVAQFIRHAR